MLQSIKDADLEYMKDLVNDHIYSDVDSGTICESYENYSDDDIEYLKDELLDMLVKLHKRLR